MVVEAPFLDSSTLLFYLMKDSTIKKSLQMVPAGINVLLIMFCPESFVLSHSRSFKRFNGCSTVLDGYKPWGKVTALAEHSLDYIRGQGMLIRP